MQQLDHPNVIRLVKMFDTPKQIDIVMDFAFGGTLGQQLKARSVLSIADTKLIMFQLVNALSYLHEQGCIHRDVKAENVLLMTSRNFENVKLSDLG
jgi:serine/threonine protein kinase